MIHLFLVHKRHISQRLVCGFFLLALISHNLTQQNSANIANFIWQSAVMVTSMCQWSSMIELIKKKRSVFVK